MPNSIVYNVLEACRAAGCPICRLEAQSVERYLDNQFYENVNSPKWRDRLRASLGFCREHAWLGVNKRLGDALGYSIIYHDMLNTILNQWAGQGRPTDPSPGRRSRRAQISDTLRNRIEKILTALSLRKRCPICEHRDETTRTLISVLLEELNTPEMRNALEASEGLCLSHWQLALEQAKDPSAAEALFNIQRQKLESLRAELEDFIRKSDYRVIKEGYGKEGDAWLRAIAIVAGRRD